MRRRALWSYLAVVALAVAVVFGVDELVDPEPSPPPVPEVSVVEPVGGTWVCAVGDGREGTALTATVARPPGAGAAPAAVDLDVFEDGELRTSTVPPLFPEAATARSPELGEDGAVAVGWRDGPVTLHREWVIDGDDLPPGIVAGGCVQPLAERWFVPGMVTEGGSQAVLRIANPFPSDATIGVGFVGTDGPVAPLALRNLSVRGRSSLELDVNEFLPERADLTAVVHVASGRVAVQGMQLVRSAIGGIDGVSVLDAAAGPAEEWTVPWLVDREDAASWLWIHNPSDRVAPVELSYHTEDGGIVPEGLTEVLVEPGQLRRVDLRGTFPEDTSVVAVTARSDGTPVVVSAAVELADDDVERTAFTVQLGSPLADSSWTVSGGATASRVEQLHLVNRGSEPARASVSVFTGVTVDRPEQLQELEIPAGASRIVEVADGATDRDAWTAFVTADAGELVVGRVGGAEEGPRRQVSVPGVPAASWRTESAATLLVRGDGTVQRLRTSLGIAAAETFGTLVPGGVLDPGREGDEGPLPAPDDSDAPDADEPDDAPTAEEPPGTDPPDAPDGDAPPDDTTQDPAEEPGEGPPRDLPGDGARAGTAEDDDGGEDGDDGGGGDG